MAFASTWLLLLAALPVCADNTAYNKGVDAWRVKDFSEARKQWELSLAQGGPDEALNNLGYLLYHGLGGNPEPARAVELWRKGAALGVSEAQLHLGRAYRDGRGVERSLVTAYAWYRCAIANAGKLGAEDRLEQSIEQDAKAAMDKLLPVLSSDERLAGDKLAVTLISKYGARLSITP